MAYINLSGRDPHGTPRLYILHIPSGETAYWTIIAEEEGWTELTTGKYESEPEPLPASSESSERPS